jgi:hypothetical protein
MRALEQSRISRKIKQLFQLTPRRHRVSMVANRAMLAQIECRGRAMMISQPALLCLEATWRRMISRGSASLEREPDPTPRPTRDALDLASDLIADVIEGAPAGRAGVVSASTSESSLPDEVALDASSPLTANERRARAAALRGLALSRGRRFDGARAAFVEAARLDPMLDLTRIPGFWKLERAAHEAVIEAYQETGRERDEAVLRARVRSTYRPKPLRPRTGAALSS